MNIGHILADLRTQEKLSQAEFAKILGVSQQSVQKWESGVSLPELEKIVSISKYFGISLDALIFGNDKRVVEETGKNSKIKPQYQAIADWEFYASDLPVEYIQSLEEGLDIEKYGDIFSAVSKLPNGEFKKKFGDILFEIVTSAKQKSDYKYTEPSELEKIKSLRNGNQKSYTFDKNTLEDKIHGAWLGRICGCMLGKTVEGIKTNELVPFLKETKNYPMHRYIYKSDLTKEIIDKYKFGFARTCYADEIDGMPVDDDTNYLILAQEIIEHNGKNFTPNDVANAWIKYQSKNAYFTAERVAYCNFIKGYTPPFSALHKNPYREWIGAQIRGDYFGYINPASPELAAEMAWRDASISHVKNGIYGEMFVSAMLSVAASTNNIEEIISGGLAQIPATSRLYEEINHIIESFKSGTPQQKYFDEIHAKYDEYTSHGWCHTISNAMIVVASLLYGKGDYGKSVCMAVETGFDTDCNGATVGSILGMANGLKSIPEYWTKPINNTLHTSIFGIDTVKISERVKQTLNHIF